MRSLNAGKAVSIPEALVSTLTADDLTPGKAKRRLGRVSKLLASWPAARDKSVAQWPEFTEGQS